MDYIYIKSINYGTIINKDGLKTYNLIKIIVWLNYIYIKKIFTIIESITKINFIKRSQIL